MKTLREIGSIFKYMINKKSQFKGTGGWEIAINPKDLKINGFCRIFERPSTSGPEEVPDIEFPYEHAISNKLIQLDQPWCVEFNWQVIGPLACLLAGGIWKGNLLLEKNRWR